VPAWCPGSRFANRSVWWLRGEEPEDSGLSVARQVGLAKENRSGSSMARAAGEERYRSRGSF
jgi:hypothetical protein